MAHMTSTQVLFERQQAQIDGLREEAAAALHDCLAHADALSLEKFLIWPILICWDVFLQILLEITSTMHLFNKKKTQLLRNIKAPAVFALASDKKKEGNNEFRSNIINKNSINTPA